MGRLLLALLITCAASGCIDWGSLYDDSDGGSADSTPERDASPNPVGCSDGTAEALIATTGLAACAGAWSIPGIVVETEPACDRAAGNNGRNAEGEGCATADLCAAGWHVCRDAADVASHSDETSCENLQPPEPDGTDSFIYLTRQRGGSAETPTCTAEGDPESADDVWGCGTLGLETVDCKPLNRHLGLESDTGDCRDVYSCGEDTKAEGLNVVKTSPERAGGVLCCSDGAP